MPGERSPNSDTLRRSAAADEAVDGVCERAVEAVPMMVLKRATSEFRFLGAVPSALSLVGAGSGAGDGDGERLARALVGDVARSGGVDAGGSAVGKFDDDDVDSPANGSCSCDVEAAVSKSGGGCIRSSRDEDAKAIASAPYGTPKRAKASLEEMTFSCSAVRPVFGYVNSVRVTVCVKG